MTALDIRRLKAWQLHETQENWQKFSSRKSMSFFQRTTDHAYVEPDGRTVKDPLGLGEDAVAALTQLPTLPVVGRSIRGSRKPALSS